MKRIAYSAFGVVLALSLAGAQQSQSSAQSGTPLGDYARQIKKPGATTKPKVFDNDNLPTSDKLSIVGPAAGTSASAENSPDAKPSDSSAPVTPSADGKEQAGKPSADGKATANEGPAALRITPKTAAEEQAEKDEASKQWADKLASQKEQIDLLARELDVLQREYQIRAAAMYADAGNRMRNSGDWDKQDSQYKQQIADKQKALDEAKVKLEDMQEGARKAGVPASVREP